MNKNCFRILNIFFVIIFLILGNIILPSFSMAKEDEDKDKDEPKSYEYNFSLLDDQGDEKSSIVSTTRTVMGTAITVIRIVGTGIAIIMLTYVAIKYMSAAPSEKADFKKSAMAYIVGAIVLMGTTQIIAIIADFAEKNVK